MTPSFSMIYVVNSNAGNIVNFGYFQTGNTFRNKFSYFKYVRLFKFCVCVPFPKWLTAPAFTFLIPNIFQICSQEKMRWANAKSIVTFVQNLHFFWNFSNASSPTKSMREVCLISGSKPSISIHNIFTSPLPAASQFWNVRHLAAKFINLFKKPISGCFSTISKGVENGASFVKYLVSRLAHNCVYVLICQACETAITVRKPLLFSTI